jgi:hypothetical protein
MTGRRQFHPDELGTDDADELAGAGTAAAWLDAAVDRSPISPRADFGDRVMAALASEPAPSAGGFLLPLRRKGALAGFSASVRQAWGSLGAGRPATTRASALAYVLVVAIAGTSLAGATTIGLAGALGMIGPSATASASPAIPGPTVAPQTILPSPESAPPEVTEPPDASETPENSDDHGGGSGAEESDDHGAGDDDHADESEDPEHETPDASRTPRPTGTPEPKETDD